MSDIITNNILESVNTKDKVPDDLVSFEDCPNHCNKGKIFDPYKHTTKLCPYCAEKRRNLLHQSIGNKESEETLLKRLNLKPNLFGTSFDFTNVVLEEERAIITEDSYVEVRSMAEDLLNKASLGENIDNSFFFSFGVKANILNFVYPLMIRYYLAGMDIAPFMNASDVGKLRLAMAKGEELKIHNFTYDDLLKAKLCVVWLDSGCCLKDIDNVHGLMETRAFNYNYATIIISSVLNPSIFNLLKPVTKEGSCLYLASQYSLVYKTKEQGGRAISMTNNGSKETISNAEKKENRGQSMGAMSEADFEALLGKG